MSKVVFDSDNFSPPCECQPAKLLFHFWEPKATPGTMVIYLECPDCGNAVFAGRIGTYAQNTRP